MDELQFDEKSEEMQTERNDGEKYKCEILANANRKKAILEAEAQAGKYF